MRTHLSSKGQLVLPAKILRDHSLRAGSEIEIEEVPGGVLLRFVQEAAGASLDDLLGGTGYTGPKKSLAEMEASIRAGARARR